MDKGRLNLPVIAGAAIGVLAGLIVGVYIYTASETHRKRNDKLHDSAELITQCRERLKEIEDRLESVKTQDT